jgi:hypothetical protein
MKLLFLIPIYKEDPVFIYNHIRKLFPNSEILFQVDNIKKDFPGEILRDNNARRFYSEGNMGLKQTLLKGYKNSLSFEYDYLVRIDADVEYRLDFFYNNQHLLNTKSSICYGFKRTLKSNGFFDSFFNSFFGVIEGFVVCGKSFPQHSPSLIVIPKKILLNFLLKIEKASYLIESRWGLDLITLYWLSKNHKLLVCLCNNSDWRERRSCKKIFKQAKYAIIALFICLIYVKNL